MSNGFYNTPIAVNEPVKEYAPGSPELTEVLTEYKRMYNTNIDVPMYIHDEMAPRVNSWSKASAYLKISEGCDHRCAFCIIPQLRGKLRSRTVDSLVVEATRLASEGVKEINLISQDSTAYGRDLRNGTNLGDLVRALHDIESLEWIRVHYAYPHGVPQAFLEAMAELPKVVPYIDIPLQHINDDILMSMKRGNSNKKTNVLLEDFRNKVPGIAIRTTLIVGYPGETNEKFRQLKQWVQDTKFDRLGVFTYSHEENTSAYKLKDDVPENVKKARAQEIMDVQSHISWELNQKKVGKIFKVLFDRKEGNYFIGRTEFDSPDVDNEVLVNVKDTYVRIGDFANVKIEKADFFDLYGVVI